MMNMDGKMTTMPSSVQMPHRPTIARNSATSMSVPSSRSPHLSSWMALPPQPNESSGIQLIEYDRESTLLWP